MDEERKLIIRGETKQDIIDNLDHIKLRLKEGYISGSSDNEIYWDLV